MKRGIRISASQAKRWGIHPDQRAQTSVQGNRAVASWEGGFCAIDGDTPQQMLWRGVCQRCPGRARWEYTGAVPGRAFRLDVAFPAERLAVEVDGFQHHGKYVRDFRRDRERQNLLTLHGWRILRFPAGTIRKDLAGCLEVIEQALAPDEERDHA